MLAEALDCFRRFGVFHFADGKITEAWFIDEDPYTADAWYDAGL